MVQCKFIFVILCFSSFALIYSQTDITKTIEYVKAIESLRKGDKPAAISLFQKSIRDNGDAPSYYELAKIYWKNADFILRNKSFEYMKMAVMKDEKNIEYKYFYADICQYFARFESVNQWKEIVALDNTQINALINLAEFSRKEFAEWDKSVRIVEEQVMSLQKWANIDFDNALNYYEQALKIDSTNYELCLKIALLYEMNNPKLGIPHLKRLEQLNKATKNVYQCLGLLYYKSGQLKESYNAYNKALKLMTRFEKEDFTLNSIVSILSSHFPELKEKTYWEQREIINMYWKENDPLIMTDFNERLLEHYSRVAYANLHFSIPRMFVDGWKSDRGEFVLRYGEPFGRVRVRPDLTTVGDRMKVLPKQELWSYGDFTISFSDPWFTGNFTFANDHQDRIADNLRRNNPTKFRPKFEGPVFDLPYRSYQFASKNKTQTDVFLTYSIDFSDTSTSKERFAEGYDVALFILDDNFNKQLDYRKTYTSVDQSRSYLINSLQIALPSQNGNLAFEMIRKKDKGVMTSHGKYVIKDFSADNLMISDIVLASDVETDQQVDGAIERNNIDVLPNLSRRFNKNDKFFLYYEIYNLGLKATTDFEQTITVHKKEEKGIINSLLSFVGLAGEEKKVALTSKYQTQEKDPQMYLQLDLSKYEPGEYVITVSIKDNINGKETSGQTEINWQ